MGTKLNPGDFDCIAKALPDEPFFVLLARDTSAPDMVLQWANERMRQIVLDKQPNSDLKMIDEAVHCAGAMRRWREQNDGLWRKEAPKPDPRTLTQVREDLKNDEKPIVLKLTPLHASSLITFIGAAREGFNLTLLGDDINSAVSQILGGLRGLLTYRS